MPSVSMDDANNTLLQNLGKMYAEGRLTDFEIKTADRTFKVHKMMLAAHSDVFGQLFVTDMLECKQGFVTVEDITSGTMEELLNFIYFGYCTPSFSLCLDLLIAADKYNFIHLKNACETYLSRSISIDTITLILSACDSYDCLNGLKLKSVGFIKENIKDLMGNEDFMAFLQKNPNFAIDILKFVV